MSAVDEMRKFLAAARGAGGPATLSHIEAPLELVGILRQELKLSAEEELRIDGVLIVSQERRVTMLAGAVAYAYHRWHVGMSRDDVASLFKAVGDDELEALVPIIIDQHMDDHGYSDPVEQMDEREVQELRETLKEIGYVDVEI